MNAFDIFRWVLIVVLSVNLIPTSVPMAALAYKMQFGAQRIPIGIGALWLRSLAVAVGFAVLSLVILGIDYYLVTLDFPPGVVHLTFLLLLLPAGIWYVWWMFALEEPLHGFTIFLTYITLPGVIVALLLVLGWDQPVWLAQSLLRPTV